MEKFAVGDIVKSNAGHDKNRLFIVISIDKNGFLGIIDCKYRKKENPKFKNPKHLELVGKDTEILNKLSTPATPTEIYKMIKSKSKRRDNV